jgi:hypothetical protein
MKKFSLAVLAIAAALLMSEAASAQNYDFSFNGIGISASGTLYAPGTFGVTPGNATTGSIVVTGDPNLIGTTGTLFANSSPIPGSQATSPSGFFFYDDTLYPVLNPSIDNNGLLFLDNGYEVNIYSNGAGNFYQIYDNTGFTVGNGSFTLTYVPEGGSFYMLALCALGLAGVFLFKVRRPRFFNY